MKRVRVVGCGSPTAGDDRAGLLAAQQLRSLLPPEVDVQQDHAGGAHVDRWCEDIDTLVILDAARATPHFPVGTIRRIDYRAEPDALGSVAFGSTHSLAVADALRLAGQLHLLPPVVIVYAIAGQRFQPGDDLSPPVHLAVRHLAETVRGELLSNAPWRNHRRGSRCPLGKGGREAWGPRPAGTVS